ncbi:hypothetical protein C8Q73DRAFT_660392 [Cubamyces lactineus]|nr:hypothetical protein C8Q73DRAFT_660392 [Cubamyces lactineus]
MTGAIPTVGNPFPAPPMNMGMGMPSPAVPMGMPEPIIPGHGQSPEAPVIPPMPSSFRGRNGTPFHRPASSPWDSSSTDDDEITQERRERMQPPLAPGQYGPYDRLPDRRRDPTPALRRSHHRRAESSPAYRRDESPPYGRYTEPPVIPNDAGGAYDYHVFPPGAPQVGVVYPPPEPPLQRQPSPLYRPRPWSPIRLHHNPLPPPPKDLFEQSPYARVLQELRKPIDEAEIKARLAGKPAIHTVGAMPIPAMQPGSQQGTRSSREKKRKGLFRSLSSRLHSHRPDDDREEFTSPGGTPQVFVGGQSTTIYPVVQTLPDGTTALVYNPPVPQMVQAGGGMPMNGVPPQPASTVPPVMPGYVPGVAPAVSPGFVPATSQGYPPPHGPSPGPMRMPTPQPAAPEPPPPPPRRPQIRIDRHGQYAGLLHTSLHKVHYDCKSYPTAMHLLEALRFLPAHPDYAEQVRRCGTPEEASAIASNCRHLWRQDWESTFENVVDEVLYQKLIQHPRLRNLLLDTGDMDLVFADHDAFWGEGPVGEGLNHLGRSLMRVRERLRAEGVDS